MNEEKSIDARQKLKKWQKDEGTSFGRGFIQGYWENSVRTHFRNSENSSVNFREVEEAVSKSVQLVNEKRSETSRWL